MKRKIAMLMSCVILLIVLAVSLMSCGNRMVFDTKYSFETAIIKVSDDESVTVTVKGWKDYEDGCVQIITTDGKVYLTHYNNIILIGE